jgi:hypothetical protein
MAWCSIDEVQGLYPLPYLWHTNYMYSIVIQVFRFNDCPWANIIQIYLAYTFNQLYTSHSQCAKKNNWNLMPCRYCTISYVTRKIYIKVPYTGVQCIINTDSDSWHSTLPAYTTVVAKNSKPPFLLYFNLPHFTEGSWSDDSLLLTVPYIIRIRF